jgi:hypothetical protein
VGFSLLFDRTYETWDRKYNGHRAGELGVYDDVLALYHIVGITAPATWRLREVTSGRSKKGHMATMVVSAMVYTPVWVYFGGPLKYYGVISSLGITYSHWTQNMIPSRCGVDISMSLLPKPAVTQNQNLDDNADFNNRIGISPNKAPSMADINRADYGGKSGR